MFGLYKRSYDLAIAINYKIIMNELYFFLLKTLKNIKPSDSQPYLYALTKVHLQKKLRFISEISLEGRVGSKLDLFCSSLLD
jgi:hypothetical protein